MKLNRLYHLLSLYGLVAGGVSLIVSQGTSPWLLFGFGQLALPALLLIPASLSRPIRLTDPINLLVLALTIGTVLGSAMLAFGDGGARARVMAHLTLDELATGSLWMVLSLLLVSLGYSLNRAWFNLTNVLPKANQFSPPGVAIGVLVSALITFVAIANYIQATGGFSLAEISRKRSVEFLSDGQIVYAAGGYAQLLASVSRYVLLILLGYLLMRRERIGRANIALLTLLFLMSALLPFLSSNRGNLMHIFIGSVFVVVAFRQISVRSLLIAAVVPLVLFGTMTGLRDAWIAKKTTAEFKNPLMSLPESGNGLSVASTTAVLLGVPDRMDYQYGATFATWIFAPIPRTFWPAKPEVSLGKRIKEDIYRLNAIRNGFPASIMAEGYINFGWVGFVLVSFLFGALLRLIANSFEPVLSLTPTAPVLYYIVINHVVGLCNNNLSQGLVRLLTDLVSFAIAYMLLRYIISRKPQTAQGWMRRDGRRRIIW